MEQQQGVLPPLYFEQDPMINVFHVQGTLRIYIFLSDALYLQKPLFFSRMLQYICIYFTYITSRLHTTFYVDNGRTVGYNPIQVKKTLTLLFHMFKTVRLKTNLWETKVMVCTPGFIWGKQVEAAYKWRTAYEGGMFRERNTYIVI